MRAPDDWPPNNHGVTRWDLHHSEGGLILTQIQDGYIIGAAWDKNGMGWHCEPAMTPSRWWGMAHRDLLRDLRTRMLAELRNAAQP